MSNPQDQQWDYGWLSSM